MKIGGGAVLWATIIVMFFRWTRGHERNQIAHPGQADYEPLTWADVERELARTSPPPDSA